MKAFKCDRCGKFYGKYKFTNEYAYRGGLISVCHVLGNGESKETLDLCEECRMQLVYFMNGTKEPEMKVLNLNEPSGDEFKNYEEV